MQWSRYNRLFRSSKSECFLYNILTNTLLELDEEYYKLVSDLKIGCTPDGLVDESFTALLREKKVLVGPGEEERLLLVRQYQRHAVCSGTFNLGLTICPTLRCNFRCPYCFESSQRDGAVMSPETANRLVEWIKEHEGLQHLYVYWYGGEPLLAFNTICDLTEKFKSLDPSYKDVGLVTNGYLLDKTKIDSLNDLMISSIQITLDGPSEIHDTRRVLAGGDPTYARIMENLETLMASDYAGSCNIRMNVDKNNMDSYRTLRSSLLKKFEGKKLAIYPGRVDASQDHSYDHNCILRGSAWTNFTLDTFRNGGDIFQGGFYPGRNPDSVCVATNRNGYVVGPEGELYKCWDDVGNTAMVVGNIHVASTITDPVLLAEYYTGNDPYADPVCCACDFLPICGGGCSNKRLRARLYGEKGFELCTQYKECLFDFLEAYVETFRMRQIADAVLSPGKPKKEITHFRVISPEVRTEKQNKQTEAVGK